MELLFVPAVGNEQLHWNCSESDANTMSSMLSVSHFYVHINRRLTG